MNVLAWSNGIKPERSLKKNKPKKDIEHVVETKQEPFIESSNDLVYSYNSDIPCDYKLSNMETINSFDITDNRREIFNDKISSREVISKPCANPFLTHLNYSDDILQQERFLIPKNSNMEKEYEYHG